MKKVLILGITGKMGTALNLLYNRDKNYKVIGTNSKDTNAKDFVKVEEVIKNNKPDIVFNCVAKLGIKQCEKEPQEAFLLNTLYPRFLANMSNKYNFILVHFSTDAVFGNSENYIIESTIPTPLNIYGVTKYGADCFIQNIAKKYYICRLSLLFGPTSKPIKDSSQYVENIISRVMGGEKELRIAKDVIFSPGYSIDVAISIKKIIEKNKSYGIYHVTNSGCTTLYDFTKRLVDKLFPNVNIIPTTIKEFYGDNQRNTNYPMKSEKISDLRPWEDALDAYCRSMHAR